MPFKPKIKSLDYFSDISEIKESFIALSEPTGFENRNQSTLSFSIETSRAKVTLVPDESYDIWFNGVKHTISTTKNILIEDTEGLWAVYFDTDDELKAVLNPGYGEMLTTIKNKVIVALVYWDATNKAIVYDGEERHGCIMDGMTHYYLHYTRGLTFVEGLGLDDFAIGNGSSDTHAQFSVAGGLVSDEDLGLSISPIAAITGLPILYRIGANGYWRKVIQAGFSCYQNPDGGTNRLMWNNFDIGDSEWKLAEVGNNRFVLYHMFMTTGKSNSIFSIMGQNTYLNAGLAREGAATEISSLLMGALPTPEIRPLGTVIYQTGAYSNSIHARIVLTDEGENYVDWRTNELPRGTVPGNHGNLTGLNENHHPQYALEYLAIAYAVVL